MESVKDTPELMNILQASDYLGISRDCFYKMLKRGSIPEPLFIAPYPGKKQYRLWSKEQLNSVRVRPQGRPKVNA